MIEALWSVEFAATPPSNAEPSSEGAGVVVFETGRVFGGDSRYYYAGNYSADAESITATIGVHHYAGERDSVFGDAPIYTLRVSGAISRDTFQVTGKADGSDRQFIAIFTRRAELPG